VTIIGLQLTSALGGAVLTETVFNINGMGRLIIQAIRTQDYALIMGTTLFFGFMFVVGTLLTDLTYAYLDPRVTYEGNNNMSTESAETEHEQEYESRVGAMHAFSRLLEDTSAKISLVAITIISAMALFAFVDAKLLDYQLAEMFLYHPLRAESGRGRSSHRSVSATSSAMACWHTRWEPTRGAGTSRCGSSMAHASPSRSPWSRRPSAWPSAPPSAPSLATTAAGSTTC